MALVGVLPSSDSAAPLEDAPDPPDPEELDEAPGPPPEASFVV
jgi:hypothetical protein